MILGERIQLRYCRWALSSLLRPSLYMEFSRVSPEVAFVQSIESHHDASANLSSKLQSNKLTYGIISDTMAPAHHPPSPHRLHRH